MPSNILVIEDEGVLCKNIVKHLKSRGHTVASAEDGGQGLEDARRIRSEIVILDIRLPTLDGITVGSTTAALEAVFPDLTFAYQMTDATVVALVGALPLYWIDPAIEVGLGTDLTNLPGWVEHIGMPETGCPDD